MDTCLLATKTCSKCGKDKPLEEFHVDRSKLDSRKPSCRQCTNQVKSRWRAENREKVRSKRRASYGRNRDRYLAYNRSSQRKDRWFAWKLNRQFGITVRQFNEMLIAQSGCCAICGKPPEDAKGHRRKPRLHVDHDHISGVVRGLLCNNCNAGIGYLGDSVDNLIRAAKYLEAAGLRS